MPSSAPRTPPKVPAIIAAAVLITAPLTAQFEGLRTRPYKDVTGTPTVCFGDTEVAMRVYTPGECAKLLRERLARDYGPRILKCVPAFEDPKLRFAYSALLDGSYNAGYSAACKSRMALAFKANKIAAACHAFVGWYETSKGKKLKVLVRRRGAERELCLTNQLPGYTEQNLAQRLKKWGVTLS